MSKDPMTTVLNMHMLKQTLYKCLNILSESLSLCPSLSIHFSLPSLILRSRYNNKNRTYTFFKGSKDCAVISRAVNTMVIITVTSFRSGRMKGHSNSTNDPASVMGSEHLSYDTLRVSMSLTVITLKSVTR